MPRLLEAIYALAGISDLAFAVPNSHFKTFKHYCGRNFIPIAKSGSLGAVQLCAKNKSIVSADGRDAL